MVASMTRSSSKNDSRLELGILRKVRFSASIIDDSLKSIDSDICIDIVSDEDHPLTRIVIQNSSSPVSTFMYKLESIGIKVCILKNPDSKQINF